MYFSAICAAVPRIFTSGPLDSKLRESGFCGFRLLLLGLLVLLLLLLLFRPRPRLFCCPCLMGSHLSSLSESASGAQSQKPVRFRFIYGAFDQFPKSVHSAPLPKAPSRSLNFESRHPRPSSTAHSRAPLPGLDAMPDLASLGCSQLLQPRGCPILPAPTQRTAERGSLKE